VGKKWEVEGRVAKKSRLHSLNSLKKTNNQREVKKNVVGGVGGGKATCPVRANS